MSQPTAPPDRRRLSGFALAGLVLSVIPPTGPLGLYLSYRGLFAVNASDGRLFGRGAAIAGLLLGALWTLVGVVGIGAIIIARLQTADARVQCANNLRVIGGAVYQYSDSHNKVFPRAVVPLDGVPPEQRASWMAAILPYLDAKPNRQQPWQALADRLDLAKPWADPANREAGTYFVSYYLCPGHPQFEPRQSPGVTHYVGVAGVGDDAAALPAGDPRAGFFGYERNLTRADVIAPSEDKRIKDTSYKIMVVETTQHNGSWIAGGPPTVRGVGFDPTFLTWECATLTGMLATPHDDFATSLGAVLQVPRPEGPLLIGPGRPFGGCHPGGMNILWADGSVRWAPDSFPPSTFRMQASLSDDPAALAQLP
jgi:prepilin-type processing-associated H-X9-DG protein